MSQTERNTFRFRNLGSGWVPMQSGGFVTQGSLLSANPFEKTDFPASALRDLTRLLCEQVTRTEAVTASRLSRFIFYFTQLIQYGVAGKSLPLPIERERRSYFENDIIQLSVVLSRSQITLSEKRHKHHATKEQDIKINCRRQHCS
jgi:hypothetical protein